MENKAVDAGVWPLGALSMHMSINACMNTHNNVKNNYNNYVTWLECDLLVLQGEHLHMCRRKLF